MPTKGNVRRILRPFTFPRSMRQYAHERQCSENNKHSNLSQKNKAYRGKIRESEKAEDFASGSARNSASLSFSVQPF